MEHICVLIVIFFSSPIGGNPKAPIKPTVILTPNLPLMYKGESVILQCKIQEGGGAQWKYEWRPSKLNEGERSKEYINIRGPNESDSGEYSCRGTNQHDSTDWSDVITLTVYKLSVSPSWLNPGDSVTLSCEVEHPPAGTRFFWYKAVPKPSTFFYNYELLPGSSGGTDENSFIVHDQTNTVGYVCEAGDGELKYRFPSFVWSADPRPAAFLSVNPDRVQHFNSDSVSLNCEGNSAEWRVRSFKETGFLSDCKRWGSTNGSSCTMKMSWSDSGVYWYESGSGEFSNAINITVQNKILNVIILVSPVHPVTEGDPVTLSCRDEKQKLSNVFFYHNDKLLQNDSKEELKISAVSKSDEGFYKCEHLGKESPRSWMSVRVTVSCAISSSFPVLFIGGPVVGIILIILLLLLWRYKWSKDSWCIRSESSSQSSTTYHGVNQTEGQVYSSLLHGDTSEYATIQLATNNRKWSSTATDRAVYYNQINNLDNHAACRPPGGIQGKL